MNKIVERLDTIFFLQSPVVDDNLKTESQSSKTEFRFKNIQFRCTGAAHSTVLVCCLNPIVSNSNAVFTWKHWDSVLTLYSSAFAQKNLFAHA